MLITNLFWFHPLLWWLGARLVEERERACDESVLDAGNDPRSTPDSILKVCAFTMQSPLVCAAGVSGANLKQRMEMIMENRTTLRLNAAKKSLLAAIAALPSPCNPIGTSSDCGNGRQQTFLCSVQAERGPVLHDHLHALLEVGARHTGRAHERGLHGEGADFQDAVA